MKKILLFAAATLALAACNNDDEYVDNGPVAVQVTATIRENAMTRASNTSWAAGDKIGITTLRKDESKYINMEYTTTAGDGGHRQHHVLSGQDRAGNFYRLLSLHG